MTLSIKRMWRLPVIGLLLLSGACMPMTSHRLNAPPTDPVPPALAAQPEEGGIYAVSTAANLFTDLKASRINDIVTINVVESTSATDNATTGLDRSSSMKADWSGILETFQQLGMIKELGNSHSVDFGNQFDGKGTTTRSSRMTAFITARVIKVQTNGNLVIRGARDVRVNNENQYIYIQGEVRPVDISSTNVVLSTYIADAVIELSGYGVVSDKQHPGLVARLLDWIWPF
jgi:flagellar L-ring protein precursor FlgH